MLRQIFIAIAVLVSLTACQKSPDKADAVDKSTAEALLIAPEDLVVVRNNTLASGPSITGSVQPERRADLRAEVSAVVIEVLRENGDVVRQGDVLLRLDETSIRDSLSSADASTRAAALAVEQAQRQLQRVTTLRGSGMASVQAFDDAESRLNNAQSELAAAMARGIAARQQLQRTVVRAPFDGIVSDRKVSSGDTAQVGKELVKVIDPSSLRLEGLVSADSIGLVAAGQAVHFRVNGYGDQEFVGKVRRVNPAANITTRQVEVLVDFVGDQQPKLAGLYAEGRIEAAKSSGLTVPATALVRDGDAVSAWRVNENSVQKVSLEIGERDARSGDYVLKGGLAEGDQLLRHPSATLKDGQAVKLDKSAGVDIPEAAAEAKGQ